MNLTREVETQEDLQIAAELPVRSGVDGNRYSCIFGFKQKLEYRPDIEERVFIQTPLGEPNDYYFMTGTNTPQSPIEVRPGDLLDVTVSELQTYRDNTQTINTGKDPWNNFPYEKPDFSDEAVRRWHPAKHYCNVKYPGSPGCS